MLNFKTELTDVGGNLIITGQTFPTFANHDPLSQLWSKVKLLIEKRYSMKPCAVIFRPAPETTVISIFPNWAYHEQKCSHLDQRLYAERFRDTFELQTQEFEDVILSWLDDDEFGLPAYRQILESNSPIVPGNQQENDKVVDRLELLTDDFLVKINLRQPNRIQRKRDADKAKGNVRYLKNANNPNLDDAS